MSSERSFKMAGNWRVTSCNGGKGEFLFTEWQRGKEHLIVPGIGQREKVVEKRISLRGEHGFRIKHETYRSLQIGESDN